MKTKVLGLALLCALVTAASSLAAGPPIVAKEIAVGKCRRRRSTRRRER
jgi:hypothetical protein